jgi:hypothetical protein
MIMVTTLLVSCAVMISEIVMVSFGGVLSQAFNAYKKLEENLRHSTTIARGKETKVDILGVILNLATFCFGIGPTIVTAFLIWTSFDPLGKLIFMLIKNNHASR